MSAGGSDVVSLRNLQINGIGSQAGSDLRGVKFISGASLVIDHCDISGTANFGISIQSSTPGATTSILNSTTHENHGNGIAVTPPAGVTNRVSLDHVRSVNNGGYGLASTAGGLVQAKESMFSNNTGGGVWADRNRKLQDFCRIYSKKIPRPVVEVFGSGRYADPALRRLRR